MLNAIKTANGIFFKPLKINYTPMHLFIEPSSFCNLDCIMCNRDTIIKNPANLKFETLKKIIESIKPMKVSFSGFGEPLINPEFIEMVKYLKNNKISVNTTTNGILIKEEKISDLISSGIDLISISMDASTDDTYSTIRTKDVFNKVVKNVKLLVEGKRASGKNKPYIRICFVIQKNNSHEISDFIKLASNLNVDIVYFQILDITAREDKLNLIGEIQGYDDLKQKILDGLKLAEELKVKTNLPFVLREYHKIKTNEHLKKKCIVPWYSAYVDATGNVMPCCKFVSQPVIPGNILNEPFGDIWNKDVCSNLRANLKKGIRPYERCKNCSPETLGDIFDFYGYLPGFLKIDE